MSLSNWRAGSVVKTVPLQRKPESISATTLLGGADEIVSSSAKQECSWTYGYL